MLFAIGIMALALLLIGLEFFLPTGLFAVLGAIAWLFAIALFFSKSTSIGYSILYFIASIVAVILICKLSLKLVRASGKEDSFFLAKDQEGYKASTLTKELIGKEGKTLSKHQRSGKTRIGNETYESRCKIGVIDADTAVIVTGVESQTIYIEPKDPS